MKNNYSEQEKQSWTEIGTALNSENVDDPITLRDYSWITEDGKINEVSFCKSFVASNPIKCVNGIFYGMDGVVEIENLRADIYQLICEVLTNGVAKKVDNLIEALKLETHTKELPLELDRIHVVNGVYYLNGNFEGEKQFCRNRLNVNYNPEAPKPEMWLKYLKDLVEEEDIPTIQEYLGYMLIPSNKGQKLMMILGRGGEGKSRMGLIIKKIFSEALNFSSIEKVEHNKFARADLENKLVMIDDDMKMEALKDTNYIKTIVTLEDEMDLERKQKQSVQGKLFVRFLLFGNGSLSALHDKSYGFYRRQLIITTKKPPDDRVDDPYLVEKIVTEKEGIFLWMLEGLQRLLENNYKFTISDRAKGNLLEAMQSSNNVIPFLESEGYIRLEKGTTATSKAIYNVYCKWCEENAEKPMSSKTVLGYLKQNSEELGIEPSTNIPIDGGKKARGFKGIFTKIRADGT